MKLVQRQMDLANSNNSSTSNLSRFNMIQQLNSANYKLAQANYERQLANASEGWIAIYLSVVLLIFIVNQVLIKLNQANYKWISTWMVGHYSFAEGE